MVGTAEAGFEVTQDCVEPSEFRHLVGFARADDHGLVVTPGGCHPGKAGQPIENHRAAGGQGSFGPVGQGVAGKARYGDHFGVERTFLGIQGNRRDKRDLVFGAPAGFAADPFAAQIGVVHPHLTAQGVLGIALGHRLHDLVLNQPGGGVAHAELALQGQGGQPCLGLTDQVNG